MSQTAGVGRQFLKAAMAAPFLSKEGERSLALDWKEKGDAAAMHQLAASHMRLVIALANRFRQYGLSMPDLIQEGHIGLLEAAVRFEPERDVRFSTYATWWIRASIQDYVLRNWSIVRGGTSSSQKALFFNLRRLRAKLYREDSTLTADDVTDGIAAAIGVSRADVAMMEARLSGPDTSLNAPLQESEGGALAERMDFLVDSGPLPDETVGAAIDGQRRTEWLRAAMQRLGEREFFILSERRLAEEPKTLEALGERLGISKERVRQIENRAIEKLRRAMVANPVEAISAA